MSHWQKLKANRGGTGLSDPGAANNVLASDGAGNWQSVAPNTLAGTSSVILSTKTASFTASDGAGYYYRMTTNDMTVTLPASPADGSIRKFKMVTSGKTATFTLNGAETINHATGEQDQSLTLTYDQGVIELIAVSGGWDET